MCYSKKIYIHVLYFQIYYKYYRIINKLLIDRVNRQGVIRISLLLVLEFTYIKITYNILIHTISLGTMDQ